jgi:(1->4)-alpha-D-glucan 1-alpha-D-glucosylmutase
LAWHDIWGNAHQVPAATLRVLRLHVPADDDEQAQSSLLAHESERWNAVLPPAVVVRQSRLPAQITLRLPAASAQQLSWQLIEESGAEHEASIDTRNLTEIERATVQGRELVAWRLPLEHKPPPGYHRLGLTARGDCLAESSLIVAPDACYEPPCLQDGGRVWGPSARFDANTSAQLGQWRLHRPAARAGAVGRTRRRRGRAQSPARAVPHNGARQPYSPSSRLFLNPLYLDPERVGDLHDRNGAQIAASRRRQPRRAAQSSRLTTRVAAAKLSTLELLYSGFASACWRQE